MSKPKYETQCRLTRPSATGTWITHLWLPAPVTAGSVVNLWGNPWTVSETWTTQKVKEAKRGQKKA